MWFNPATLFVVAGAAVVSVSMQRVWLSRILAAVTAIGAAAASPQYFTRTNLGIDALLFSSRYTESQLSCDRMPLNSAICLGIVRDGAVSHADTPCPKIGGPSDLRQFVPMNEGFSAAFFLWPAATTTIRFVCCYRVPSGVWIPRDQAKERFAVSQDLGTQRARMGYIPSSVWFLAGLKWENIA